MIFFNKWSNWEHVDFVSDCDGRITELFVRHADNGITQYRHVHVGKYMSTLGMILESWKKQKAADNLKTSIALSKHTNDETIPF